MKAPLGCRFPTIRLATGVLLFALSAHAQTNSASTTGQELTRSSGGQDDTDLVIEAKALYRQGHFDEAAQKYEQLLQAQPKSAEAYAGLTRVYLKQQKVQLAHDTISLGLRVVESAPMRVALGEVLFREGKLPEAESEWLNAVNSDHANARAYLGLARLSTATTQYEQAKREIDKAHALGPSDPDIEFHWLRSLKPSEQVPYLENYLSHEQGTSAEEQTHLRNYLEFLKAQLKSPTHGCQLASELPSAEADLLLVTGERPNQIRGYGLAVALNGKNSKLQVDTGASGILIDHKVAQKAGLTRLSDMTVGGFGDRGESSGYFAMAESIKIGPLELRDCPVMVVDKRSVLGEDGVIGTDTFQEFLINLDFHHKKLRLRKLPRRPVTDPGEATVREGESKTGTVATAVDAATEPPYTSLAKRWVPGEFLSFTHVFRFGHMLLIPTEVGDIQESRLFLIDTGSARNVLSVNVAREITKVRLNTRMTFKGLSGSVNKVYGAEKTELHFSNVLQYAENQTAIDLDHMSDSIETEISGVFGVETFCPFDVIIDYRDGLVAFDTEP